MLTQRFSFTTRYTSIVSVLRTEVKVAMAMPFQPPKAEDFKQYWAVWDTGAMGTVISRKVVQECGLKPISVIQMRGVTGTGLANIYTVHLLLRNNVCVEEVNVADGNPGEDCDVLIGMNIITQGDFAVTNYNGNTVLTFRIPSCEVLDFVKDDGRQRIPEVGRNDPCPCGSGKKYKQCHGKR